MSQINLELGQNILATFLFLGNHTMENTRVILPEINCDLGEGVPGEEFIFPLIDTASVACGGHFGSEESVKKTLELAKKFGKKAGAHPSYPDRENFGRKSMVIHKDDLAKSLEEQISLFLHVSNTLGMEFDHIKFHGALYNDAAKDDQLADFLTDFILKRWPKVPVFVPPHSRMEEYALKKGLPHRLEIFGDRAYLENYQLAPRTQEGSLLTNKENIDSHLKFILFESQIKTVDGKFIPVKADTLCFHGDNPGILEFLSYLRKTNWT